MENYIIISLLLVQFLFSLYSIFLKEYFKEKGKNLATKEDISIITQEIEKVKNELSFQQVQKLDWLEKNKNSLLEFYTSYISLTEQLFYIPGSNKLFYEKEYISNFLNTIEELFRDYKNKYYIVCMYELNDKEFLTKSFDITSNISKNFVEISFRFNQLYSDLKYFHLLVDSKQNVKEINKAKDELEKRFVKILEFISKNESEIKQNKGNLTLMISKKLKSKIN